MKTLVRIAAVLAAAAAMALIGLSMGCASLVSGKDKDPPSLTSGKTQAGYGRVNAWATDEKTLVKDIEACAKSGVTIYHVEFLSWARYNPNGNAEMMAQTEKCYKAAIKACRKNGVWLFVSFANSNTGSGKYGDPGIPLSKMGPLIEWGKGVVLAQGPKNVLFQPLGETGGSFNSALELQLAAQFGQAGFIIVNNHGSRPTSKPGWAHWNAWHPWKVTDTTPNNQIIVSDTGTIIQQLCWGLEGKGKPDTTRAWAQRVKATGAPAVVFYHFKYQQHDPDTIKAMGEGVK